MRGTEVSEDDLTMLIGVILGRFEIKNCLAVGFLFSKRKGSGTQKYLF